ncbi:protein O-mannosyl-transferase TMTC2-like, partial [Physella acuta]|uniref:protein O-mannosyl-transferase TMTC2-like n=1 Tax=Physella acuta TaxID=109671 RepID=UPI0027DE9FA2
MIVYYSIPALLAALCYMNGQHGDFVHDDVMAISHNRDVTGQSDVVEVFYHDFWGQPMWDPSSHKSYRPLCVLSFRLDYSLGGGSSTWFHRVNILLHVLVTCLVTHVSLSVLQAPAVTSTLAASLFAVHPIHTEA